MGFKADGGSEIQSVIFDKSQWTASKARSWLTDNDFSSGQFEEAKGDEHSATSIRFDALEPDGAISRRVRRYDVMPLARPELTPEGFVRAQGMITRTGVFLYRRGDGTIVRELRPPEEVFKADSLRSFSGMALTLDHPPDNLTPETVSQHQVGNVSSPVRVNNHVRADITILRQDAIKAVMNDRKNKLSCGYVATVIDQGGVYTHADGTEERFDSVQTNIVGNHVAICDNPRAGSSAQIRVDDAIADIEPEPKPKGDSTMEVEITINGKTYKVSKAIADQMRSDGVLDGDKKVDPKVDPKPDQKLDAHERALKEKQDEADRLRGENAALKAKLDASEEKKADEKKRTDAKESTKARIELCAVGSSMLEKKLDELLDMEDLDIMKACIEKASPDIKLDGESEEFIRGVFKTIATTRVDTAKEITKIVNSGRNVEEETRSDGDWAKKADDARDKMRRQMQDAWKPKHLREAEKAAAQS